MNDLILEVAVVKRTLTDIVIQAEAQHEVNKRFEAEKLPRLRERFVRR